MKNSRKHITFDDVTAWMAGEADEETRQAIARELEDPTSPTAATSPGQQHRMLSRRQRNPGSRFR